MMFMLLDSGSDDDFLMISFVIIVAIGFYETSQAD